MALGGITPKGVISCPRHLEVTPTNTQSSARRWNMGVRWCNVTSSVMDLLSRRAILKSGPPPAIPLRYT